jgi:hypothetical protein
MFKSISVVALLGVAALGMRSSRNVAKATPADGHTIHVLAPHLVNGKVMGPFHHYCKVISPEPVIECLIYDTADSTARLGQIEYIVAKSITRSGAVPLATWNKNWHDHQAEIATGRVQVLDLPADQAKKVADIVATTDGIVFSLWPDGDKVPSGNVTIPQAVGHVDLTAEQLTAGLPAKK